MTQATHRAARVAPPWRLPLIVAALGVAAWFALPDQLGLLTRLFTTALLVLSLDLVVGIAGLATLGQAALFGAGAYAAGIFALRVMADPLVGLAVGIGAGALVALVSGAFLLRYHGFTLLMLTVAVAQILYSRARRATGPAATMASRALRRVRCSAASPSTSKVAPRRSTRWRCWSQVFTSPGGSSTRRSAWRCAASTRTARAWRHWARRCLRACWRCTRWQALWPVPLER